MDRFDRIKTFWNMAKSGTDSLRSRLTGGHDYTFKPCCNFCEIEGNIKEAKGYCYDCKEYLCAECFSTHRRPKASRHHKLLDQQQMPKYQQQNRDTDSLSSTLKGGSDYVYGYCCGSCEGTGLQKEAVGYCSDCREYLCKDCFDHHRKPKPSRHHVLLDQRRMPKNNQPPAASPLKITVLVPDDEARVSNAPLQQDSGARKTCAHPIMDVGVRSGVSSNNPTISGCVVLPGDKVVMVDSYNSKVMMADLTCKVLSELKLPGWIWDITQVSSTQVAVTSHNKQTIYFVNVGHDMKLDREIKVKGQCRGIARISENLIVVSYDCPVKVEIISMKGKLLQTVVSEGDSKNLFSLPWYIAVTKDQQTIYISDAGTHTVTSVDLTGTVQATYRDVKLKQPRGLTVDAAGTVYVCDWLSNNVLKLSADLTEKRQLLQEADGVHWPWSVCCCETTGRLYVGTYIFDKVKVFQLQ